MKCIRRDDLERVMLPGRVIQKAIGKDSYSESGKMTVGFARYSAESGIMEPHHHAEEALFVVDAKYGWVRYGPDKDKLDRGMCVVKPGSVTPHLKFRGKVYVLKKEEGGRHTPFFNGYRPQFYFRTTDVTGVATLPEGTEMVMPGDDVELYIELITPIAMEKELRFAIREGGRTVGAGVVTEIVE